nr:MAG TPA: hypothetical protein [Caudoviricetes sp.]
MGRLYSLILKVHFLCVACDYVFKHSLPFGLSFQIPRFLSLFITSIFL